ncbi:type I secretion system permease/ATPase, partial [Alphaproteobacteria bacterium]|nr:type I secretion system permease/ATPase [Alphaproteobacteria bacterium]
FAVFTRVLASYSMATLAALFIMAVFALFIQAVIDVARSYVFLHVGNFVDRRLSARLLQCSLSSALDRGTVKSIRSLQALNRFRMILTSSTMFNVLDAPWVPLFILVLFVLNFWVGIFATLGAVILFVLAIVNDRITKAALDKATVSLGATTKIASVAVRNSDVVESMGMSPTIVNRWHAGSAEALHYQTVASKRASIIGATTKMLRMVIQMTVMTAAAMEIMTPGSTMSPGAMMASVILVGRALQPLESMVSSYQQIGDLRSDYQVIERTLAEGVEKPRSTVVPADPNGDLVVENVGYKVDGLDRPILSNINFTAKPGDVIGIVGHSAAGKTTLVSIIIGLIKPTTGIVRYSGSDVFAWPSENLGKFIGYLPQNVELLDGTVKENIARLQEDAKPEDIIEAAKLVGLDTVIQNLPREYDSKVGDQGMLLSGGQRQRVGLARAMFGNPRLLVLDEPNAHLDTAGEAALNQAIVEAKKRNCIVLVVAHRPQILQFVDKVLILSEGTVQNFTDRENVIVPVAKQSPAQIPAQEKPATKQPAQDDNATKTAASGTPGSDKSNAQKSTS